MKCNQCGAEFEGNFCPECGAKAEAETLVTPPPIQEQTEQKINQETEPKAEQKIWQKTDRKPRRAMNGKPAGKKKPFFLKWWFWLILLAVIVVVIVLSVSGGEKIVWEDMILGEMLPEPPDDRGEVHSNSSEELRVDINGLSDKQYADYVETCKEKGYTVDAKSDSSSYDAYNSEGFRLHLGHYGSSDDMSIKLEAPMEMTTITWPASVAGKQLPVPKSTIGKFSYEHEDGFFVYIGDTTKADYDEYVNACFEKGFSIDYSKGEDYYYADNSGGWHLSLGYEGNNIMSVDINAPAGGVSEDDESANTSSVPDEESEPDTVSEESGSSDNSDDGGLDPDFKAAMDSYEKFMDEYVAFMKKYNANSSDASLLADYTDYLSKYADFVEDFEKWENEDMNAAETAYYIDVQTRVSKKLLEVTQ